MTSCQSSLEFNDKFCVTVIFGGVLDFLGQGTEWHSWSWMGSSVHSKVNFQEFHLGPSWPPALLRKEFGHPVNRKRLYILLVRDELMVGAAKSDFASFCEKILEQLRCPPDVCWCLGLFIYRLLPSHQTTTNS